MTRWIAVLFAAVVAAFVLAGCNTDVCQNHGGLKNAVVIDGTWYYHCNDGVTV